MKKSLAWGSTGQGTDQFKRGHVRILVLIHDNGGKP